MYLNVRANTTHEGVGHGVSKNLKNIGKIEYFVAISYFLFSALDQVGVFRYIIYLIPPLFFLVSLFYYGGFRRDAVLWYIVLVLGLILPTLKAHVGSISHAFFFAYGISIAALHFPVRIELFIKIAFAVLAALAFQIIILGGASLSFLSFSSVQREFESDTFPFILGALVGLFFCARRYLMMILCLVGLILAAKRMPIAGAVAGLAVLFLMQLLNARWLKSLVYNRFFYFLPLTVFGVFSAYMPDIFDYLGRYINLSMGEFTSGRSNGQVYDYDRFYQMDLVDHLFGDGIGTADSLAQMAWEIPGILVHSDYLRLFLDFGLIPAFIYIFAYWRLINFGPLGLYISIFVFANFLTDNSLVYTFSHILIALMGLWARDQQESNIPKRRS